MNRFFAAFFAITLAACASAPGTADGTPAGKSSEPRTRYGAEAGELTVGVIPDATVHDGARNKDIQLSIDYPTRADAVPVIVFSHALGASELDYAAYASHWASNGYVVVRVGHSDAVRGIRGSQPPPVQPGTSAEWTRRAAERAADLRFVIDSLATLPSRYPELAGKLDPARVGVAGHAFGAMAAMLAGGMRTLPAASSAAAPADPRIKAVIAMSPPGPGERRGLTAESFRTLTPPTLFLTGTRDTGGDDTENAAWRQEGFDAAAAGDKWLVVLNGAGRGTFSGLLMDEPVRDRADLSDPNRGDPNFDPRVQQTQRRMPGEMAGSSRAVLAHARAITLAFWDAYLRGDAAGREFLTGLAARGWGDVRQR